MKILIAILIVFLLVSSAFAGEMVSVPMETLIKIRDYIVELQTAYNNLVDQLNEKDQEISVLYQKIENYKRRSSGVWLGASAGLPFPSATVHGMYIINNSVGIMLNAGYSKSAMIQAGVMVRVGK